jgi:hypothetical protein
MFQNKFILGALSILLLTACILFVVQPTALAHAKASIHIQHENNGIAVFGSVDLTNGNPVTGVTMLVGVYKDRGHSERFYEIDHSVTDSNGRYKLWISSHDIHKLGDEVSLFIQPDAHHSYHQNLALEPGDIVSVTIAMSTPLIPIFPFTIFVY